MGYQRALLAVTIAMLLASPSWAQGDGSGSGGNGNGGFSQDVPILTRADAEKRMPPPIPVIDLSKPAIVFNHPDELIRAAVSDWLSTIKQPHDQFGNLITKSYKSARAPDTLDTQIVNHIAKFVQGRRFIALSPRQAVGINQQQDKQRQNEIDRIIYDDWAAKVKNKAKKFNEDATNNRNAANKNNNGGGSSGNPNSNTGGPGQPGNSNNNGAPGGNSNSPNGNGGNGSEPVPNLNGGNSNTGNTNQPPATGQQGDIEAKYKVKIVNDPKAWTPVELGALDEVLSKLPARFYQGIEFKRVPLISPGQGQPGDPSILGVTFNSGATSGSIQLADGYTSSNEGVKQDWPTPPYDAEQAKLIHMKAILAHEIAHNFQFYGEGKKVQDFSKDSELVKNFARDFGWTFDSAKARWEISEEARKQRPSNYATGTVAEPTSPMEDMAESVAFYLFDPARLRLSQNGSKSRFEFVRQVLGVQEQPNAATSIKIPDQRGFL